tara:strand:- start:24387 stop:24677 length:291 start_codon:yes stop_codon:yes gene_type:complete
MKNRLIVTKDNFIFIDVSDIAHLIYEKEDVFMYDAHTDTESLADTIEEINFYIANDRTLVIEGGHMPKHTNNEWWSNSEKITHEGYVYVRMKDILK